MTSEALVPQEESAPELTPEAFADTFLDIYGWSQYAGVELEMAGQSGTLAFGLARCREHFRNLDEQVVVTMIHSKLAQAGIEAAMPDLSD